MPPVVVVATAALAAVAVPARADTTIATLPRTTPVTAYGDDVVWSAQAETGPARYRLMHRGAGGKVAALPVAGRSVPFDADLGPGEDGRPALVYSRCAREPPLALFGRARAWNRAWGCDVYRFSFATGREARVAGAASPAVSEFLPAVWRGRIAFAVRRRQGPRGPRRPADRIVPGLRLLERGGAVRTLPGPPARVCAGVRGERSALVPRCGPVYNGAMTGLDLRGRAVAFAWQARVGSAGGRDLPPRFDVFLSTTAGRRPIATAMPGGRTQMVPRWPAFDGAHLTWGEGCFGDQRACSGHHRFWRYRLSDGSRASAAAPPLVLAQAAAGGRFTFVKGKDAEPDSSCAGEFSVAENLELRRTDRIELEGGGSRLSPSPTRAGRSSWPAGQVLGGAAGAPELAITPRGDALAFWATSGWRRWGALRAAVRSARDTRFRAVRPSAVTRRVGSVTLAATPQNEVIAAWTRSSGRDGRIQVATWSSRGRFGRVRTLSGPNVDASLVRLVVNRRGDALLAWREGRPDQWRIGRLALRPAGGSFARIDGAPDRLIDAALGDDGRIVVTSGTSAYARPPRVLQVAERSPLGTWSAAQTLDSAPELWDGTVAIARDGAIVVAWNRYRHPSHEVAVATRSPAGAFARR